MGALLALVGRPNVGKSTLFNRRVGRSQALVDDRPGVTRDRHYGDLCFEGRRGTIIDTGGFDPTDQDPLIGQIKAQALAALDESDLTVLVVDGRSGPTPHDRELARLIRRSGRPHLVAVNKIDSPEREAALSEFHELGLDGLWPVSAAHGYGLNDFKAALAGFMAQDGPEGTDAADEEAPPRVAVIGRPNAGKSSLINRLTGQDRLVVDSRPGTTRDAVAVPVTAGGRAYVFIDTAGVRRRGRVDEKLEKLSVLRALKSLDQADAALLVVDALAGLSDQDAHIAGYAHEKGRPVVILANKWDLVRDKAETLKELNRRLELKLGFLARAPVVTGSARTGLRLERLFELIDRLMGQYRFRAPTAEVNRVLETAVAEHTPPYAGRGRLKFYYATQAATRPPTFVVFTNRPDEVHFSYRRFLVNRFKEAFGLDLAPVRLLLRVRSGRREGGINRR
jgi:GTP-binding protein